MNIQELCEKNNHYAVDSAGNINTRCPFCGDSQKLHHLKNYGQAYIYSDGYSKCFKCGKYSTAVEFIEELFHVLKIEPDVELLNQFRVKDVKYIFMNAEGKYLSPSESEFDWFSDKRDYLSKRLMLENLNYEEAINSKFVFDIYKYNDLIESKYNNNVKFLYDDYIAYVTANNKKLILRNMDHSSNFKHIKIDLVDNASNNYDFWSTQDYISKLISSRKLVLAEGIFTVNNKHIREKFGVDCAIAASLSKLDLIKAIKLIYYSAMVKFDLILLRDAELSMSFIHFVIRVSKKYLRSVQVYSNTLENDFGFDPIKGESEVYFKLDYSRVY